MSAKHNIRFGCCAVVFRDYPVQQALEWIAEGGYENVEIEANYAWCNHADIHKDDPIKYKEMVESYGLKLTALDCHRELIVPWEVKYDPVEDIQKAIRWAKAAGVPVVVSGEGLKPDSLSIDEALENLKKNLEQIMPVAEENEIYFCFEPHGALSLNPGGLKRMMELVPSKWLGINFDTANPSRGNYVHPAANSLGYKWMLPDDFPKNDELVILKPVAGIVRNVHFKDVVGKDAVALGTGQVKLDGVVKQLYDVGFDGVLSWQTEGLQEADLTKKWMKESREYTIRLLEEVE